MKSLPGRRMIQVIQLTLRPHIIPNAFLSELHIVNRLTTLSLGIRSTPVDHRAAVHPMFAL